ncbi:MAG: 3-oxoacyl-ACP synthase III [Planctomycetes bacterium]|nr:3-oxoacyl-ACP synthase III [Planctomycetota bacterium]
MQYRHVCLESFGYTLPEEVVSTSEIEQRLAPLYDRLRLPEGRLELMTGIRERRFFPRGVRPGDVSVQSGEKAIRAAGIEPRRIGALIHGSVCRDQLEPATACSVHHRLGLPRECVVYDVSNACLGLLNGAVQAANMIELGQIEAALVVGTECGRTLVESTIAALNEDRTLTRRTVKNAVASLTIGSASCGMLLVRRELSRTGNRLTAAVARANSEQHTLCRGGYEQSGHDLLMDTDSERLMQEGIATGVETFKAFLDATGWSPDQLGKTFCHQVGVAHRKLMLESLDLDPARDYATLEWLGNTGAAALPVTMAIGLERGFVEPEENVGMLGIGSGINSLMLGVEWRTSLVCSTLGKAEPMESAADDPAWTSTE